MIQYFAAAACPGTSFFNLTPWYKFLPSTTVGGHCTPELTNLSDVWLVVMAVLQLMLQLSAIIAVVFVIYGGGQYIFSQGNPDAASKARGTIINALIGLLLSISAAAIVQMIAGRFH